MQGIAQKILAAPERYSVDMLRRAVETGLLPAYVGIPLIQAKMQMQQQMQQSASLDQPSPDQQPTVAEQVMGQAGVDALPTNLPQEYAAGGIVAFDRGGEVERFSGGGMPMLQRMAEDTERYERATRYDVPLRRQVAFDTARAAERTSPEMAEAIRQEQARYTTPVPVASATATAPAPRPQVPAAAPRAVTPSPAPGITGLPAAQSLGAPPELEAPKGPTARQQAEEIFGALGKQTEAVGRDFDERIRAARGLMQGEAFQDYKKQLEDEARRAGADRADAKNMALFKAGLAMMAGTSRHALENIGKGALVGVEDFQTAARELRKADKDRQKEFALIEQARRAEKAGNIKEEVQLLSAARDRGISALENTAKGIAAGTNMDIDSARQLAAARYKGAVDIFTTGQQTASAERRTAAQVAASLEGDRIRAAATVEAARSRAPEGMSASERNRLAKDVRELLPEAEAAVVKQMNLKTPPPVPRPDLPPTHPSVIAYNDFQAAVNNYVNSKIERVQSFIPQGRAAPPASSVAPAASNQFAGYERLR